MRLISSITSLPALALLVAALAFPSLSWGEPYVRLGVEAVFPDDQTADVSGTSRAIAYDNDFGLTSAIGYNFDGFRLEGEFGYRPYDLTANNRNISSETYSVMGNLFYDFDIGAAIIPYIGGGAGVSFDDEDSVLAYQGMLGVAYRLGSLARLYTGYRYFATNDGAPHDTGLASDEKYMQHALELGLQYHF